MNLLKLAKFCLVSVTIASAAALTACDGHGDAQGQANRGNANVQRMSALRAQIASKTGIDVTVAYTEHHETLRALNRRQLTQARDLLAEYIARGEDVLHIASRDDIQYASKVPMENLVRLAKRTQALVELRLASIEGRTQRSPEPGEAESRQSQSQSQRNRAERPQAEVGDDETHRPPTRPRDPRPLAPPVD